MSNYEIIDNYLKKEYFERIKEALLRIDFPWYVTIGVSSPEANDGYYFTHSFVYDYHIENREYYKSLDLLISRLNPSTLIRCKANLYPSTPKIIEHGKHVDMNTPHKGFIYYINTNNGYTLLEDGTKIESIENRALFFDSGKPHSSTTCTDDHFRLNINFNYT